MAIRLRSCSATSTSNLSQYVPQYRQAQLRRSGLQLQYDGRRHGLAVRLLGFADDNWVDGTQTFVFAFGADAYRDLGFGFTGTIVHEVGHHIGMSHPHDGYDSELDLDYGPGGQYWFAWEGDESDTVMQYLSITNEFGEHNRDNMYRWETAGYLNWSNALAADILASPDAGQVTMLLKAADALALPRQIAVRHVAVPRRGERRASGVWPARRGG